MSIIFNAFLPILKLRWFFFSYLIQIFHIHQIKIKITSPLRHQGINVHQQGQNLKRLMKTRLVSVEGDKKCALKCFVTQPTFTWKKNIFLHNISFDMYQIMHFVFSCLTLQVYLKNHKDRHNNYRIERLFQICWFSLFKFTKWKKEPHVNFSALFRTFPIICAVGS